MDDLSEPRWLSRLHAAGATVLTYYADLMTDTRTTPEFWRLLRANLVGEQMHLLVTCDGVSGLRHLVAVSLRSAEQAHVIISDSASVGLQSMAFDDFVVSCYAQASQVQQLLPADLEAHAEESAADYLAQHEASRQAARVVAYQM